MAFDLGGIGTGMMGFVKNSAFWVLFVVVIVGVSFGALTVRKARKFTYPAFIFNDLGQNKTGVQLTKAGWFKTKKTLFGLLDVSGERRLETKDGRIVQQGSTEDFHELNHKRGLILQAKSDDPKILIPVKFITMDAKSRAMIMSVAPADYRDASSKILSENEKEMKSGWESLTSMIIGGLIFIIALIAIILTIQYSKQTLEKANAVYEKAWASNCGVKPTTIAGKSP